MIELPAGRRPTAWLDADVPRPASVRRRQRPLRRLPRQCRWIPGRTRSCPRV